VQVRVMIGAHGLAKSFGSVQAMAGLDMSVTAGTTMCLIGIAGQYADVDQFLTGRANLVMIGRPSLTPRSEATTRGPGGKCAS